MVERGYQYGYSHIVPVILEEGSRIRKAEKILLVLEDYLNQVDLGVARCLDIGCSSGVIARCLSEHLKMTVGCDIDRQAIRIAENHRNSKLEFLPADAMLLPFKTDSFEVVICNHVYAHVPDCNVMMKEIHRVLTPGGICYFAAGNRLAVLEGNYRLPFLSWLPQRFSNWYLKAMRGIETYHERHLTYWQLRRMVRGFDVLDYTLQIIQDPGKFGYSTSGNKAVARGYGRLATKLYCIIPTYIWLLRKTQD